MCVYVFVFEGGGVLVGGVECGVWECFLVLFGFLVVVCVYGLYCVVVVIVLWFG